MYSIKNKEYLKKKSLEYRLKNKDKIRRKRKAWYKRNRIIIRSESKQNNRKRADKIKVYRKQYYLKNKKKISKYVLKHNKERYKIDIDFKLRMNLRHRLYLLLTKNKTNKSVSALKLLGCSLDFFKNYLASQFTQGMSWSNYGLKGWVVDHVRPCCSFDLTKLDNQKICFHYTNLRPLWKKDNDIKSRFDKHLSLLGR